MNITHPQVGPYGPPRAVWPAGLTHLEHTMPGNMTQTDSGFFFEDCESEHTMDASKMASALDYIARRLQMDVDDGSRPDQWTMEDLIRTAMAALPSKTGAKP